MTHPTPSRETRRATRAVRTYQGGCYQHYATYSWCEMCRAYADAEGLPMPRDDFPEHKPQLPTDRLGVKGAFPYLFLAPCLRQPN